MHFSLQHHPKVAVLLALHGAYLHARIISCGYRIEESKSNYKKQSNVKIRNSHVIQQDIFLCINLQKMIFFLKLRAQIYK